MSRLIPFEQRQIGDEPTQTVNARDLHAFLGSKQEFATWIKNRIKQYGFTDSLDFTPLTILSTDGTFAPIEYYISLGMAKELAMVERNAKGKEARLYFLACEKQLQSRIPVSVPVPLLSHDRITLLKASFAFLQELGMADDRDRLMYADIIRTTTRQEFLPQHAAEGGMLALPAPQGFFVAERVQALGYQFTRQQEANYIAKVARLIAREYRSRYGTEPSKAQRYVDGAVRPVNWYQQEEASWADVVIQRFFADYPEIAREHAQEER